MKVRGYASAARFLERAGPWLQAREAENNLIMGIALACAEAETLGERETRYGDDPPWFAVLEAAGQVVGAAFRTPPHMLGVTDLPLDGRLLLATAASGEFAEIPGVVGPPDSAEGVAGHWALAHGATVHPGTRMKLMKLDAPPRHALRSRGTIRSVTEEEVPFFTDWLRAFEEDTGIFSQGPEATVRRLVTENALFTWEVDGAPVAMAGLSGATPRAMRIGYVYTPPERRGLGYARDITAVLSRRILESGREFSVLYVDVHDPVPNHIYTSLGYTAVAESQVFLFSDP